MRIVLVNWARIWDGASFGGGVNQYCQALALELLSRGHEVISLFGGTTYIPAAFAAAGEAGGAGGGGKGCFIRRHDDWLPALNGGVKVFEVVNSPVMAPSIVQYAEPMGEVSAPELEDQVGRLMLALRPDAVHWNNIEGFSAGCVAKVREVLPHVRQIFSLHNYHTICPQVYLMQGHRRTCYSFDNGHACTNCIPVVPPAETRAKMEAHWRKDHDLAVEKERAAWHDAMANLKRAFVGPLRVSAAQKKPLGIVPGSPVPLGGASGDIGLPVLQPLPPTGALPDPRGKTPQLLAELNPFIPPSPDAPELQPLTNDVRPDLPTDKPLNDFGRRRAVMIAMLNSCDRVLAVSDFVRRKFVSMGVNEAKIDALPIGSRINRVIALKPDLLFDPPALPPRDSSTWQDVRPLRLHFMGYNNYYKGLHVVAEALERLSPAHLRKLDLSIYALDGQSIEWLFRRLEPRLHRLTWGNAYNYHDIPWMLGGKDLTIVPSVWWDNAPQTVFESLSCGVPVLGANIGGIPDFVHHGVNGLLFTANSRPSLAEQLTRAIEDPWMVESLRANVHPTKSIEDHAKEMEAVYAASQARFPVDKAFGPPA